MSDETTVSVNFGRPMPVFPLSQVVLLPNGVVPLNVFEERYRQMVSDALDGSGQIALGVYESGSWHGGEGEAGEGEGRPPLRPAVCIGQIVEHHRFGDGRYVIMLQGICRAQILYELPPSDGVPYRQAMLEPVGLPNVDEEPLREFRDRLGGLLSEAPLTDFKEAATVVQHLADDEVPTSAIMELVALAFLPDPDFRYRFLAEGEPSRRGRMVIRELEQVRGLLRRAASQRLVEAPRGCSWN
jgi:Lon protease-like protein